MMRPQPNVWTCGAGLVEALARQVLAGFPLEAGEHDLSRWTILVPTRRAARALEQRLFTLSEANALLLPRVRPIGDADEDLLADVFPDESVPDALPKMGQLFLMLSLVDEWAKENPHLALAADVNASRSQALGLAESLSDLVSQLATEEVEASLATVFRELDLAGHRQTIISLLALVQERLPARLAAENLIGPSERRNRLIRLEAKRIAEGGATGPIIAAGSTGSNPATRDLLRAIAHHPQGAVVLPGLDLALDDAAWDVIGPNHPQHALKILLAALDLPRSGVRSFAPESPRQALVREMMRPAGTTEQWAGAASLSRATVDAALRGVRLMEAPDRQHEARTAALLLREVLEQPGRHAALVTPDRDLAQMISAELQRWNAFIDDSGGEPLIRFGRAQLCKLLIDCVEKGFSPPAMVALLSHPDVTLGRDPAEARLLAQRLEVVLLRQDLPPLSPLSFSDTLARVKRAATADTHLSRFVRAMEEADWAALAAHVQQLASALAPLVQDREATLAAHVDGLATALAMLAPGEDAGHSAPLLEEVFESLRQESARHPVCRFRRALSSIVWALRQETLRAQRRDGTRLSIYGLAEARMIEADLVILAGLNETIWPAATDPGPWVNRSMRTSVGLAQPEREIGMTAHDLAQGMMHGNVVLMWSKRAGTAPLMPSRWILRLRALLEKAGLKPEQQLDTAYVALARALDAGRGPSPVKMPRPAPPVGVRPTSFSVTEIEKLVRDPYWVFARRVLKLEPLDALGGAADPALRGTLFHDALRLHVESGDPGLASLLAAGEKVFAPYIAHPDVRHFWWPRFRRMAEAFVTENAVLREGVAASLVERGGRVTFRIGAAEHTLRARADRIDVLEDRTARLIDYKTGTVPSTIQVDVGLSPQLTLEAAMLRDGGFGEGLPQEASDLVYIHTGGGHPPVTVSSLTEGRNAIDIKTVSARHFGGLKALLARYQTEQQAYIPRAIMFSDEDASDYDHLSRHAEWSRGGA
ncbi:MAG: double-strand break repair protein AddB [Rhizobiales bacterium]|nr:double-strand break repair protein AddB [Hyphomicrobiales bacterium]